MNRDNPLGMHGEIAQSYADLIHTMWGGKYTSTAPRKWAGYYGQIWAFCQNQSFKKHGQSMLSSTILKA